MSGQQMLRLLIIFAFLRCTYTDQAKQKQMDPWEQESHSQFASKLDCSHDLSKVSRELQVFVQNTYWFSYINVKANHEGESHHKDLTHLKASQHSMT